MIMDGKHPARPREAQKLGLTDSVWNMTVCCWLRDPTQRPAMTEVIGLLQEILTSSFSIEAGLMDFLQVCKNQGKDGQGEKVQEFADRLDEVRQLRDTTSDSHHMSRVLKVQIFMKKNASSIWHTCDGCAVPLAFFHPRSCSHQNSLNVMLLPSTQAATQSCTRQPFVTVPL